MLKKEQAMFQAGSEVFLNGQKPSVDIVALDKEINIGEQMVRRLVIQHLAVNPEQDLPTSLVLVGIVHDVERVGDYIKGLLELSRFRFPGIGGSQYAQMCREIQTLIEPMLSQTLEAFRESDAELARQVMRTHREVKSRTDILLGSAMQDPDADQETLFYGMGSRTLRRISAHLSNIASGIANPFDRLSRNIR